jgi:hypothetical protein
MHTYIVYRHTHIHMHTYIVYMHTHIHIHTRRLIGMVGRVITPKLYVSKHSKDGTPEGLRYA